MTILSFECLVNRGEDTSVKPYPKGNAHKIAVLHLLCGKKIANES